MNYPSNYDSSQSCTISVNGEQILRVKAFETERRYDELTVGGTEYSGTDGPPDAAVSGKIVWTADSSVEKSGWKFCAEASISVSVAKQMSEGPFGSGSTRPLLSFVSVVIVSIIFGLA